MLLQHLRRAKYDLALDVSGSSAALGFFIVGFSGARLRARLRGKWDRWFNRDFFVACDSGPLHLACALKVRAVASFLKNNFDRWGSPPELSRIVFCESGVGVTDVLKACQIELSALCSESVAGRIVNG